MTVVTKWSYICIVLLFSQRVQAQVRVLSPPSLVEEVKNSDLPDGLIPGSTATFGAPSYGSSLVGRLWYVDDITNEYCTTDYVSKLRDLQKNFFSESGSASDDLKEILLLRRGKCTFVTKVKIAEGDGEVDAVIMVDEKNSVWSREDVQHIIMADDGHGARVLIPSILLSYNDGERLVQAAKKATASDPVLVQLEWSLPQKAMVRIDFWTDAGSKEGSTFLKEYAKDAEALRGFLDFYPHYYVYSLPRDVGNLCWPGSPEFCSDPPDGLATTITGREVLQENLRQICLRTVSLERFSSVHDSPTWWIYVQKVQGECPAFGPAAMSGDEATRLSETCSYRLMNKINPKIVGLVKQCVAEDWRKLLSQERENKAWSVLALRINNQRFGGNLDAALVSRAVCSAFQSSPRQCSSLPSSKQAPSGNSEGGMSARGIFILFAFFLFGIVITLVAYQRFVRKSLRSSLRQEVMMEVRAQMQEYHQLTDDGLPEDFRQSRPLV